MLSKKEWWEVIAIYNESIFPLQWISLLALVCITSYLMFGKEKGANKVIKAYLLAINVFIGIRFFFLSEGFPLLLRIIQGILFLSIALLIGLDIKYNKSQFQFPKNGWKRVFFIIGSIIMMIYPFVGAILGKEMHYWIMPGTLPCPTTAYTLLLFITAKRRNNKLLFILLLVWAVPFPPLVQIPKYHVYEDGILFVLGLIGLVFLISDIVAKKDIFETLQNNIDLKAHKKIFGIKKDAVLATVSNEGIVNIVPIHSKHLIAKDKVLISDQFMDKTKRNVMSNPYVTLSIIDNKKIYKLSGKCVYKTSGFLYAMAVRGAKKYAKNNATNKNITIKCKGIISLKVNKFSIENVFEEKMRNKTEIANYIDSYNKCFAAFLGDENYPQVLSIKFFNVENDTLIIGLNEKDLKEFDALSNQKIAITMWDKIKGYQIKGVKITEQLNEYEDGLNNYKNYLENEEVNCKDITFINYHIKEIYHVTPGKYAGKKIEMEV